MGEERTKSISVNMSFSDELLQKIDEVAREATNSHLVKTGKPPPGLDASFLNYSLLLLFDPPQA